MLAPSQQDIVPSLANAMDLPINIFGVIIMGGVIKMKEQLNVIARIHNDFPTKFGIPRQSREQSGIETRIVMEHAFRDRNMFRGIEGFSHLWLIWGFSEAEGWSATVRPPRLGGNMRMGVFATRSPFRPNHLGLSSVRLLRVESTADEGVVLVVTGADLLDGTPIYDIKPYLSFSDSHPDATNGFAEQTKDYRLPVKWQTDPSEHLTPQQIRDIEEILSQDPRPAYQTDDRLYKMDYDGHTIAFRVIDDCVCVE